MKTPRLYACQIRVMILYESNKANALQMSSSLIPPHGGYRELKSFQHAELVYDSTVKFCNRFIDLRSRTHDQMIQTARSGRQNIAEGSQASGTSKKSVGTGVS